MFRKLFLALYFAIPGIASAQDTVAPVDPTAFFEPTEYFDLDWYKHAACRKWNEPDKGLLNDIEQHIKYVNGKCFSPDTYRNRGDVINWAHEMTHGVHSLIRNTATGDNNAAVYCFKDRALVFKHPDMTLSDVANLVPRENRGQVFGLYMRASSWNGQPLYPLDELQAYCNGTIVGYQLLGNTPDVRFSYARACEVAVYCQYILRAIDLHDPNYAQKPQLVAYLNYNAAVLANLRAILHPDSDPTERWEMR